MNGKKIVGVAVVLFLILGVGSAVFADNPNNLIDPSNTTEPSGATFTPSNNKPVISEPEEDNYLDEGETLEPEIEIGNNVAELQPGNSTTTPSKPAQVSKKPAASNASANTDKPQTTPDTTPSVGNPEKPKDEGGGGSGDSQSEGTTTGGGTTAPNPSGSGNGNSGTGTGNSGGGGTGGNQTPGTGDSGETGGKEGGDNTDGEDTPGNENPPTEEKSEVSQIIDDINQSGINNQIIDRIKKLIASIRSDIKDDKLPSNETMQELQDLIDILKEQLKLESYIEELEQIIDELIDLIKSIDILKNFEKVIQYFEDSNSNENLIQDLKDLKKELEEIVAADKGKINAAKVKELIQAIIDKYKDILTDDEIDMLENIDTVVKDKIDIIALSLFNTDLLFMNDHDYTYNEITITIAANKLQEITVDGRIQKLSSSYKEEIIINEEGKHIITVKDSKGETKTLQYTIVNKDIPFIKILNTTYENNKIYIEMQTSFVVRLDHPNTNWKSSFNIKYKLTDPIEITTDDLQELDIMTLEYGWNEKVQYKLICENKTVYFIDV